MAILGVLQVGLTVADADRSPQVVVGGPNDGGRVVYLRDPDGNGVELHQLARPWPT